jgi:LysR family glycine cleavage system transcriptional activator
MYYGAEAPNWSNWFARAGISNIDARGGITFNEEAVAIQAAMAGQGIALCSTIHVADDVNLGFLVQPFSLGLEGFTYSAVYLKEHPKMPLILKFVDWLSAISCY